MRMIRPHALLMAGLLVLWAGAPDAQTAQNGWRASSDTRVTLTFGYTALGSNRTYTNSVTGSMQLSTDSYHGMVFTPAFDDTGSLCTGSVTMSMSPADLDSGAASWLIEGRLVSLEQDRATIDLRWTRRVNRGGIIPSEPFTSEQRLVLRNGNQGILDFVRSTPSPDGCDSFGITYELQLDGAPALSNAAIGYDLWMVQQDGSGQLVTERFQTTAGQGEKVNYFFAPVGYSKNGRRVSADAEIQMNVRGTVRGRIRTDGDIDLTLEGSLGFGNDGGWIASNGQTLVTVKPRETIEVPLDPPTGTLARFGNLRPVFGNHRTAIRITTHRRW